jgi:hypothetical protein
MGIMNDSLMKRNSYSSIKMRRIVILEGIDKVFQKNHFFKKKIISNFKNNNNNNNNVKHVAG